MSRGGRAIFLIRVIVIEMKTEAGFFIMKHRKLQQEFIAKGLAARDRARATGSYVSKDEVMDALRSSLETAQSKREASRFGSR